MEKKLQKLKSEIKKLKEDKSGLLNVTNTITNNYYITCFMPKSDKNPNGIDLYDFLIDKGWTNLQIYKHLITYFNYPKDQLKWMLNKIFEEVFDSTKKIPFDIKNNLLYLQTTPTEKIIIDLNEAGRINSDIIIKSFFKVNGILANEAIDQSLIEGIKHDKNLDNKLKIDLKEWWNRDPDNKDEFTTWVDNKRQKHNKKILEIEIEKMDEEYKSMSNYFGNIFIGDKKNNPIALVENFRKDKNRPNIDEWKKVRQELEKRNTTTQGSRPKV